MDPSRKVLKGALAQQRKSAETRRLAPAMRVLKACLLYTSRCV